MPGATSSERRPPCSSSITSMRRRDAAGSSVSSRPARITSGFGRASFSRACPRSSSVAKPSPIAASRARCVSGPTRWCVPSTSHHSGSMPAAMASASTSASSTPVRDMRSSAKTQTDVAGTSAPSAEQNNRVQRCPPRAGRAGGRDGPRLNSNASRLRPAASTRPSTCAPPSCQSIGPPSAPNQRAVPSVRKSSVKNGESAWRSCHSAAV